MKDAFYGYHPLVNFLYFTLVLIFSMVFMHPVCLIISLSCSIAYGTYLHRRRAIRFNLMYMLPMLILTALINPAFNHEGATIIAYLSSGNPLTLESILYGIAAAAVLITVIGWFSCFNSVITSDKFVYLFGRVIPAMSLVLSMALRLVPRFKAQARVISNAQRGVGRDVSGGNLLTRARHGIRILSILMTWALENAIDTADSMKSRGYGLPGRTSFSTYRLARRDVCASLFLLVCGTYVALCGITGGISFRYFPTARGAAGGLYAYSALAAYFALCIMPVALNIWEDRKWRALRSGI